MKNLIGLTIIIMSLVFVSTASAARFDLTLGWHNLQAGDFYLIDEQDRDLGFTGKIKTGLLHKARIRSDEKLDGTGPIDLTFFDYQNDVDVWGLTTKNPFNKWVKKRSNKAIKSASKQQQKDLTGSKSGWKSVFKDFKSVDIWSLYYGTDGTDGNDFIKNAFDSKFNGKTFKGKINGQKVSMTMQIFDNTWGGEPNPVPEPATAMLFGIGLLGLAGFGRKQKK